MKFNLDVKNFDFKKFFLTYGEWVGLGVALLIAGPILYSGITKTISAGSSKANAAVLDKERTRIEGALRNNKPTGPEYTEDPPASKLIVDTSLIDPTKYAEDSQFFQTGVFEDTKRRAPTVLSPSDFHVDIVRGAFKGNYFLGEGNKLKGMVLQEKNVARPKRKRRPVDPAVLQRLLSGGMGGGMGMGGGGKGGPGGGGGMGPGMMPGMGPGMGPPGMGGGQGNQPGRQQTMKVNTTSFVDLDKIEEKGLHLAEVIYPVRMAVVTGSFPYKQQLEEFRSKLHKKSLNELLSSDDAPFRFEGGVIERRVFGPNGKLRSDWADYTQPLLAAFQANMSCATEIADEDPDLKDFEEQMIVPGLVMARPKLAHDQEYPKVEIPAIQKAIKELKNANKDSIKPPDSSLRRRVQGTGLNPFDPKFELKETEEPAKPEPKPKADDKKGDGKKSGSSDAEEDRDLVVPEHVLVRFIDFTVEPGYTYEYRVKVRMANPNFGRKDDVVFKLLAKDKTIESPEFVPQGDKAIHARVPYDINWYAIDDLPDRDRTFIEVHRWLDNVQLSEKNDQMFRAVGDWAVLHKQTARRGEYLGKRDRAELPVWSSEQEHFEIAKNPGANSVRVDFTVQTGQEPALLVDLDGGRSQMRFDNRSYTIESPARLLVYTSDGRLIVRHPADDINNKEREARDKKVKDNIADAKKPKAKEGSNMPGGMPGMPGQGGLFDKGGPGRGGPGR
jgi:hypothetical protein